jgi:two-component system response regulator PilR (NtrC family)
VALAQDSVIEPEDLGLPGTGGNGFAAATLPAQAPPVTAVTADPARTPGRPSAGEPLPGDLAAHLDAIERDILERALERHRYNRTAAGASLGLSLRQMRYRMARLGVGAELADPAPERGEGG